MDSYGYRNEQKIKQANSPKEIVEIFKGGMVGPPHRKQIHQRQEVRKGKTSV